MVIFWYCFWRVIEFNIVNRRVSYGKRRTCFFEEIKVVCIQTKGFKASFRVHEKVESSDVLKANKMLDGVSEEERDENWDKAQDFINDLLDRCLP